MRMSRRADVLRGVVIASTIALAVSLGACATDGYEDYMSQGCDGLSQMASGHADGDESSVEEGMTATGALSTAGEEAAGNMSMRAEVGAVSAAGSTLFTATFEPPERNDGELVVRQRALTRREQNTVSKGLAVCGQYQ
jgi:hypothetical protein